MNSISHIWLRLQNELRTFIYRKVRDESLADDIAQDVFLKVYTRLDSLKAHEKLTAWIYQITRNAITDHFRKRKHLPEDVTHFIADDDNESNYNECVAGCLTDMLADLPQKYREALELTEFHNLSQIELADRLGISYSGVKSRVQRARQLLRDKMTQAYNIRLDAYGNAISCENRFPCGCE